MITMELLHEFSGSNDQIIIKRKRTKRPRPSSSTSSSSVCVFAAAAAVGGGGRGEEFHNSVSISSRTSSTGLSTSTTTGEEEEDMAANCLILLARGGRVEEEIKSAEKRESSRKFTKRPTTTIGKIGIYVYECKTCNRAFSSFQALGGHRASHKKPKPTADAIDRKKSPPENREEEECCTGVNCNITVAPLSSVQMPNKIRHHENKAVKIHECAICGSEFGSGQALGGHMRRHRPAVSSAKKIGVVSFDAETASHDASEKAGNMLALDLNMPAETKEGDQPEEKFHSSDRLALVDCR